MGEIGHSLPTPVPDWALFLDVDGTLLDIAPTPFAVTVPPELPQLVERLAGLLDGAVALVSGRSLADLDRLFGPIGLAMAGQHGGEIRRQGGEVEVPAHSQNLSALLPAIETFAAGRPGLLIENKGRTIAVHCRMAPQFEGELGRFLARLVDREAVGVDIVAGRRVFELRPRGVDKGQAIAHLLRSAPFAGRVPVFIGDDTTDEDGFAVVLSRGGHAIRVGLEGASAAPCRLAGVAAVRAFLANAATELARGKTLSRQPTEDAS